MLSDTPCRDAGNRGLEYAQAHLHPEVHRQRLEGVYEQATHIGANTRMHA
jgi:hypothetical protein